MKKIQQAVLTIQLRSGYDKQAFSRDTAPGWVMGTGNYRHETASEAAAAVVLCKSSALKVKSR